MNKKNFLFSVLQFGIFILSAEQRTYYINPETSIPLSITRNADVKTYSYTYYILNEYGNYVFGSKNNHCLASETVSREKFFSTIEDYQRPSQIEVNWNYKRDNAKNKDPFLKDGEYKLHLIETERRDINKTTDYIYTIILDREKPAIKNTNCHLSKNTVYKNKKEDFSLELKTDNSVKANFWQVTLDDTIIFHKQFSEGEEYEFPQTILFDYENWSNRNLGKHRITVTAKDCAGNTAKAYTVFNIEQYPYDFSIFTNDGIVFKSNDKNIPLYYTGIGLTSNFWKTNIYDKNGTEHFSDIFKTESDSYCKKFEWNGISQITNSRVPDGEYTVVVACKSQEENEIKKEIKISVSTEKENVKKISFSGIYSNNKIILNLKNYTKPIQSAVITIANKNKIINKYEISDINKIEWDGFDTNENFILSTGEEYKFILNITNEIENSENFETVVKSGLVFSQDDKTEQHRKILVESIHFDANDSSLFNTNQYFTENSQSIRKAANAILQYLDTDDVIIVEGNANYTTWPNKKSMSKEKDELIILAEKRAEIVKKILVFYGIQENCIKIKSNGGENPIVQPDAHDNWKNRRVELFIEKEILEK